MAARVSDADLPTRRRRPSALARVRCCARLRASDAVFRIADASRGRHRPAAALGGVILVAGRSARCRRSRAFGFDFLTTEVWNPVTEKFGALAPIYGTLVTSLIAMLIAVPVGIGDRHLPHRALPAAAAPADRHRDRAARRHPQHHLRHLGPVRLRALPAAARRSRSLIDTFGDVPVAVGTLFAGPPYGIGILTAGLILAIMILPFITAITRDVFETVPPVLQGSRLRPGLHHLGGGLARHPALHPRRRDRRRHARPRPRARRDHGGDLRHRQCARISASILAPGTTISPRPSPTSSPRPSAISTPPR